jgi:hypothetical protein
MKKILLSFFTVISLASTAQTLTYANQAPAWGNPTYQTTQCDSTGISAGANGAGSSWSFNPTSLNTPKTYTTSNTMPTDTLYPTSNVSVYSSATDLAYYHSDVNALKYYGGNLTINGFDVVLVFNTPSIYAIYPMSVGTTTSSTPSGSLTINGAITGTFTGNATSTASGTGTLTLPSKTFTDVVKVTTSQTLNATLSLGNGTLNLLTYDYYSTSASKAPIFSIQTSTLVSLAGTSSQTIVTVQPNYNIVGVNESEKSANELSVFPNPATTFINVNSTHTEAFKVIALDVTGKIIATEQMESGKVKINTSNFANGIYIYKLIGKNNQVLNTGKFTVSK